MIPRFYRVISLLICLSFLLNLTFESIPPVMGLAESSTVSQPQAANTILITDNGFSPNRLEVTAGTKITWQNQTSVTKVLRSGSPNVTFLPLIQRSGVAESNSASNTGNTPSQPAEDKFEATLASGATFEHTYITPGTYSFYLASSPASIGTIVVNPASSTLKLTPIGNQTVQLGSTLTLQLAATGADGALSFGITPLPLPPNAIFDAKQARFSFQPAETQIGVFTVTFAVTDGKATNVETITITVPSPDPNAKTSLRGRVLDANEAQKGNVVPLSGATVLDMGSPISATTNSDGYFTIEGLTPGEHYFEYDGSTAIPKGTYGAYRGQKNLIPHVVNIVDRPIYIMKIDKAGETTVNPNGTTTVSNPNIDVTLSIPAGTVVDDTGALYDGPISVSPVPKGFTPAALPDTLNPGTVVTIQPMGLKFRQPAPITFPNYDNLPVGSEVNIWSLDHELGQFFIAGTGRVNDKGMIETIPGQGGIRESSWHFLIALLANIFSPNDSSSDNQPQICQRSVPIKSSFSFANGCLESSFTLPAYNSLGESRQIKFSYLSERANPQPILPFEATLPVRAAIPPRISYKLVNFGGVNGSDEVYWDTSTLDENKDEPLRGAIAVAGDNLSTGIYPYKIRLTNHYANSTASSDINSRYLLVNEQSSPFGAGWGIVGLERIYPQNDGNLLLVDGDGAALRFEQSNLLLNDDFDGETNGIEQFNYNTLLNWDVTQGSIDIIGQGGAYDLQPGHGFYLDLDGSTNAAGRLESRSTFMLTPGQYQLSFDLAGSQRTDVTSSDSVIMSLGALYSETFTLGRDTPFTTISREINVTQPASAKLVFDSNAFPSDQKGLLLDNVRLQRVMVDNGSFDFPELTLDVAGKSNIYGAGHQVAPAPAGGSGGMRPPGISFKSQSQSIFTFSNVTGQISCRASPLLGADGGACAGVSSTNTESFGGISGISHDRTMFLAGVFLNNREPFEPAPSSLDFTSNSDFDEISPALNQMFFIGDGKNSAGNLQRFKAPPEATRLMFGFVDSYFFVGTPGYYEDNAGSLSVTIKLSNSSNNEDVYGSPAGDFSTLIHRVDGTYIRQMKDGTEYHFNASGLQTSVVDRNNNTTTYTYDQDERLTLITDPAKLPTTFTYVNGRISQVIDPMGRITTFTHDSKGDLLNVDFGGGVHQSFVYNDKHLMTTETDRRGNSIIRTYDNYGRLISDQLPGNIVLKTDYSQRIGLVPQGLGTIDKLAPIIRPADAHSTVKDGENRTTTYTIGPLGTIATITDTAGFATRIERNSDAKPLKITAPSGNRFERTYDSQGNLASFNDSAVPGLTRYIYDPAFNQPTSITDPFGNVTSFTYDAKGNLTQAVSPLSRKIQLAYESHGLPASITDTLGTNTRLLYNAQGNLASVSIGVGVDARPINFAYTQQGYLQKLTDPLNREFSYSYDGFGRVTSESLPGNRLITYQYDGEGNLTTVKPPGRPAHLFEYNGLGQLSVYIPPAVTGSGTNRTIYEYNKAQQLTKLARPDGLTSLYGYDPAGRLTSIKFSRGTTTYTYNTTTGQLDGVNTPEGVNLSYQYNGELLTEEKWSEQVTGSVNYAYDANYRTTAVSVNGTAIAYQYDKDSAPVKAGDLALTYDAKTGLLSSTSIGSITDAWNYNAFAEVEGYTAKAGATALYQTSYTHDKLGRITSKTETISGTTVTYVYSYDTAGRLSEVKKDNTTVESYTYDGNGNRLTALGGITASYDDQDRLLTYGNTTFAYTANGELKSRTSNNQTTIYTYDEFGNLTKVILSGGETVEYLVDGQNRRVGRKVNGALVQKFLYEGQLRPIAELDASNNVVSRFIYATRVNVPDYMVNSTGTYRLILDHLGSVRLVVNVQTGEIAQRMDYDAFGNVTQDTRPGFQPFGFAGGIYDSKTGLVRFGARDYDANVGRWTVKDPIRFGGGDVNLYGYIGGDPINLSDPLGMQTVRVPISLLRVCFTPLGIILCGATIIWIKSHQPKCPAANDNIDFDDPCQEWHDELYQVYLDILSGEAAASTLEKHLYNKSVDKYHIHCPTYPPLPKLPLATT